MIDLRETGKVAQSKFANPGKSKLELLEYNKPAAGDFLNIAECRL